MARRQVEGRASAILTPHPAGREEKFLRRLSTFADLPEDTVSSASPCCFSTFHPLVFSPHSSVRLSPPIMNFPVFSSRGLLHSLLSHGVSSPQPYPPIIVFRAPLITPPSPYLPNDHKVRLCEASAEGSLIMPLLF